MWAFEKEMSPVDTSIWTLGPWFVVLFFLGGGGLWLISHGHVSCGNMEVSRRASSTEPSTELTDHFRTWVIVKGLECCRSRPNYKLSWAIVSFPNHHLLPASVPDPTALWVLGKPLGLYRQNPSFQPTKKLADTAWGCNMFLFLLKSIGLMFLWLCL